MRPEPVRSSARWRVFASPGASAQSALPQTITVEWDRNETTISWDGPRLDVAAGLVPIGRELPRESVQEHVLAHVDVARRVRRSSPGALVAVTAAVPGAAVDPVRIHPPTARAALHEPCEDVITHTHRSVLALPGRTALPHCDEIDFADQRGMGHGPGHRPLPRHRRPPCAGHAALSTPHLPSRVARVGQDHRHRPQVPPLSAAVPIPLRVDSGRTRHAALVQLASDPGHTAPGEARGEHPSDVRRRHRVRGQPVTASSPPGVRLVRMRTRIDQPVSVRRSAAEKPALLDRLCRHCRHRPMT